MRCRDIVRITGALCRGQGTFLKIEDRHMKWMRFRVRTRSEAEDILVSSMMDIGMYGAQIEDNVPLTASEKEQMFVDILPQAREDDGTAVLSFYVEETERGTVLIDGAEKTGDQVRRDMEGRILTGSTTGSSISISSGSMISWSFLPGNSPNRKNGNPA